MRIGLMSDTHGYFDESLCGYFEKCDEVWHAGDFGSRDLLERLRGWKQTRGVYGNIDDESIRAELPEDLEWECEGVRVYMTHIGGYPGRYDRRALRQIKGFSPGLFVCGHSHVAKVARDPAFGLLHMNPGACGNQGWHTVRTALRFTVSRGKIGQVELIRLGPRGSGSASDRRGPLAPEAGP